MKIAAAGGFVKWLTGAVKATKLYEGATKAAGIAQRFFNTALKNNPLGIAITAIFAIVAALTAFFTKTETGRKLWSKFMDLVRDKLEAAKTWFSSFAAGVRTALQPLFDVFAVVKQSVGEVFKILFTGEVSGGSLFGLSEGATAAYVGYLLTLRDVAIAVWNGIKVAWDALSTAIGWAWANVIKPSWDALAAAGLWLWQTVLVPAFTGIKLVWDVLATAIQFAWTNIIKPTWDAISVAATWLWQTVLVPAFTGIKLAFQGLGEGIAWVWTNVIKPVWDGIAVVIQWLWDNIFAPYIEQIKTSWSLLGQGILWVWDTLIRPAFDSVGNGARNLWESNLAPTFQAIKDGFTAVGNAFQWIWDNIIRPAWDALGAGIRWVVDNVVMPAFHTIRDGLDRMKGWFRTAVDSVSSIWDGIRAATAKPVRFVIDTVFNKGIRRAWNAVAGFAGLDKLQEISLNSLGNYARGGVLPGYTPGRDPYEFIEPRTGMRIGLSGGEAIVRPEATRVLGSGWVDGINSAARIGGAPAVAEFLDEDRRRRAFASGGVVDIGDFARGGVVESIVAAVNKNFPMMTITSTYRNTNDHHGAGKAVDFSNSTDSTPQMRQAAQWFYSNYGSGLLELIHSPFSNNVKNGKNVGDGFGFYGAGTMNGHRNHVHVASPAPLGDPTVMVEMIEDGGGGGFFDIGAHAKKLWDGIIDKLPKWDGPGLIGKLPGAMLKKLADSAWNFVKDKFGVFSGNSGVAGNAESWREMAMAAMRRNGFNADDPAQVNAMLKQIMSESGGIPNRVQEIVDVNGTGESAGVGLLQIIPGTFATHRDPTLPNDRKDAWANMNAALRYYRATYGGDLTTMWGHGHGYASGGVLPGFTPGRDVHRFWSPTGGVIDLSGGESIMVPEWTRDVGGPKAVAAMNAAARRGRFSSSAPHGFANGGTYGAGERFWQPIGDQQRRVTAELNANLRRLTDELVNTRNWNGFVAGVDKAMQPAVRELEKIADPHTYEGIAARAAATQATEIVELVGLKTTADVFSTALGAEKQLVDSRDGYESRIAAIVEKERQLLEAREALADLKKNAPEVSVKDQRKLADAEEALAKARKESEEAAKAESKDADKKSKAEEKAKEKVANAEKKLARVREDIGVKEGETAEKRAEDLKKATESVSKAESELVSAREASARALDMLVFDVAPQINAGLLNAAGQVRQYVPQASDALMALAAMAGPAGLSVGQVVDSIKVAIEVVTKVIDIVDRVVGAVHSARLASAEALHDSVSAMREFTDLVAKQQQMVANLQIQLVRSAIAQTKAAMDARNATAAMVRARLEGDRAVADARTALEVEIQAQMRRSRRDYSDLSLAYDRYRYGEWKAMDERLEWQETLTPELKALQLEVDAAELTRMANVQRATMEAIEASYAHRNAARAAQRASEDLSRAAEMLALMTGKTFGLDQTQAYVGEEVARLYAEKAKLQAELSSVKNNLSLVWRFGGGKEGAESSLRAVNARIAELEARPEFAGFGVDDDEVARLVKKAQTMYVFGRDEDAARLFEGSALGDARRALDAVKFEQGLASIKNEIREGKRDQEDLADEVALEDKVRPLRDSAAALDSAAASAKYRAESLRAEDPAVAAALRTLADFERENAVDIQRVSRGETSRIEIAFTDKAAYSAAEVDVMLEKLGSLDGIELRIEKLEASAAPGPADLMRLRAR